MRTYRRTQVTSGAKPRLTSPSHEDLVRDQPALEAEQHGGHGRAPSATDPARDVHFARGIPVRPKWPIDWQRTCAASRECLVAAGAALTEILPGATLHGQGVGKWLENKRSPPCGTGSCRSS
ncbi:MAG: helicase, partial [Streptomyces oryziradicis]|nr:helicase [Actinacidiphila oryziradicis]